MNDAFDAYLIPTGLRDRDGVTIVSAVLVLRPFSIKNQTSIDFLHDWPTQVAAMLPPPGSTSPPLMATARLIDATTGVVSASVFQGRVGSGLAKAYGQIHSGGGTGVSPVLTDLWRNLLQPANGLEDALRKPAANAASDLHDAVLQADPNQKANGTPDIISPGRADLSHLLKFKRAGLVRTRVDIINAAASLEGATPVRGVVQPEPLSRPWALAVQMKPAPAAASFTKADSRANQVAALAAERKQLLSSLNDFLDGKGPDGTQYSAATEPARPRAYAGSVTDNVRKDKAAAARKGQYRAQPVEGAARPLPQGVRRAAALARHPPALEKARVDLLHPHVHSAMSDGGTFAQVNHPDIPHAAAAYDAGKVAVPVKDKAKEDAFQRWAAVLGLPTLQRVLHLVVDIEIAFDKGTFPVNVGGAPSFVALGLTPSGHQPAIPAGSNFYATLAKVEPAGRTIWPCTREECRAAGTSDADTKLVYAESIDQHDGVVDLEAALAFGSDLSHRFSVDTLDIHAASESEVQRDRSQAHAGEMIAQLLPREPKVGDADFTKKAADFAQKNKDAQHLLGITDSVAAERKLRTVGWQVIDQWRDSTAIKQFVRTYDHLTGRADPDRAFRNLLDVDDLTLGLRLDVAADNGDGQRKWACLTNRTVGYAYPANPSIDVEHLITAFLATDMAAVEPRAALDGVVLGAPTRLLADESKTGGDPVDATPNTAYAEPIVATWDGDPLGMRSGRTSASVPSGGLPLNLHFDLPTKPPGADQPLPPRLRFGAAYAFGLRSVLLGNVVLPLSSAAKRYDAGAAYPQPGELKRFVRHEWIDPVMVATPLSSIVNEFRDRGGLDGEMMIVRSVPKAGTPDAPEDGRRFQPRVTERVVFAPRVDLNFAHLHGVFDGADQADRLLGGLRNVDFDPAQGGFPAYAPELPPGFPLDRGTEARGARCTDDKVETPVPPSGLAVFQPRRRAAPGRNPQQNPSAHRYYPDPAARHTVVALRAFWDGGSYLAGSPWIIPLYPYATKTKGIETPGYPHACPLVIRLEAYAVDAGALPLKSHEGMTARVGRFPVRTVPIDAGLRLDPENVAQELTIRLAPGEDFALDVWTLPDLAHIGAWFDLPESMAFLDDGEGLAPAGAAPGMLRREDMRVPASRLAKAAADLHQALQRRPVAEFAPARVFRLVHAAERPASVPVILARRAAPDGTPPHAVDPTPDDVAFRRVDPARRAALLESPEDGVGPPNAADDDATSVLADARVAIDPATFEAIALHVEAAAPAGGRLDDPDRGRSPEDRIRGDWPPQPTKETPIPNGRTPSELLYGFKVAGDGSVAWIKHAAIYDTWRIGPGDDPVVSLLALTARGSAVKRDSAGQQLFADGGARRITAWVTATSRTARLIPPRKVYPDGLQSTIDAARTRTISARQENIILRSIVRPAALPVRSLSPAFFWSGDSKTGTSLSITRTTRIRIPFLRPSMTSGVEERVGIVLWPPNALRTGWGKWRDSDLAKGTIERAEPLDTPDQASRQLNLMTLDAEGAPPPQFRDEDLGPGGAYVTRWGADPIHEAGELTWFITSAAFRDADWSATVVDSIRAETADTGALWPEEDTAPRLVENVLMPIPSGGEEDETPEGKPKDDKDTKDVSTAMDPQFMMVSLLTYVPRFDADTETWYADVEIDPGVAPDPFLRLGLVRFQPHANRNQQVSMPVAEWVQVVGHLRTVEIWVRSRDALGRPAQVQVRVRGAALARAQTVSPVVTFRGTLIARQRNALGRVVETVKSPVVSSEISAVSDDVMWEGNLPLLSSWGEEGFEGYAVYVEEIMRMRRSDYPDEPHVDTPAAMVDRDNDDLWRESGPRFATRLEINATT